MGDFLVRLAEGGTSSEKKSSSSLSDMFCKLKGVTDEDLDRWLELLQNQRILLVNDKE